MGRNPKGRRAASRDDDREDREDREGEEVNGDDADSIVPDYTGESDTMRVLRVQLEFRHPGLLMSAAPDPYAIEAARESATAAAAAAGRKRVLKEHVPVKEQARRSRYLVPGSKTEQLALPARNLLGSLKGAARSFRAEKGAPRTTARIAAGAAILPSMIPLLNKNGSPRTDYNVFVRMVPIPTKGKGSVPVGRAQIKPPCFTAEFEFCVSTMLFPWDSGDEPQRASEAMRGRGLIEAIFKHAGDFVGVCAWRPSAPLSPGPFGKFHVLKIEDTGKIRGVDEVWEKAFASGEQGAI